MTCTVEKWCDGVKELVNGNSQHNKGLVFKQYLNFKTGKSHTKVGYNLDSNPNGKWYLIEFCPACGTNLYDILVKQGHLKYAESGNKPTESGSDSSGNAKLKKGTSSRTKKARTVAK